MCVCVCVCVMSVCARFAIYIPLFLPVGIPIILSLIAAVRWLRGSKQQEKTKTE